MYIYWFKLSFGITRVVRSLSLAEAPELSSARLQGTVAYQRL